MSEYRIGDWSDIQIVLAVARFSSFQAAASALDINQSTVSRRVQRLEGALGTKIFDRQLGGMRLSPAGNALFEKAQQMETVAKGIEANLSGFDTELSGTLTISSPEGLGYLWLADVLSDFHGSHPDIAFQLITDRQGLNLLHHDADISIVMSEPMAPRLVAVKVADVSHTLFAAAAYISKYGLPTCFEELGLHRFVEYLPYRRNDGLGQCMDTIFSPHQMSISVDSASVLLSAVRAGFGIGLFPTFYGVTASDLVQLPMVIESSLSVWIVSHEETNQSRKTRLVIDHLKFCFKRDRKTWFSLS